MKKTAIITGITGQDGAYLAEFLLKKDYRVIGLTRGDPEARIRNLEYLKIKDKVEIMECDLLDLTRIIHILQSAKADEIYNLAAQSSVGYSFSQPIGTIHFNIISVVNLLESIRLVKPDTRFYQASSSEMYGKVKKLPVTIDTAMHPLSPYAISKASAHWIVVNYRESYNLYACNGVLFNHESYLRHPSFFIKKIISESIQHMSDPDWYLSVGNIEVSRDFGYSPKYVEAMWLMLGRKEAKDFLICSGKSYMLKDIIHFIFSELNIDIKKINISSDLYRPTDILDIYGDNSKLNDLLGWDYNVDFFDILKILIHEEKRNFNNKDNHLNANSI